MSTTRTSELSEEIIFSLNKKNVPTNSADTRSNSLPGNTIHSLEKSCTILCILRKNLNLGAAYYKTDDQQIYVLQDIVDNSSDFEVTQSLFYEVEPTHTITIGYIHEPFVKSILNIISNEEDEAEGDTDLNSSKSIQSRPVPSNLTLLHFKDFSFQNCEAKVYSMNLPGEPDNLTQREVFLHSLIDFDCKMSVYSIGALIKFMERNWSDFVPNEAQFNILNINKISLQNKVLIDRNTFNGLQVFEEPSQSLRYREPHGFSIFKLFSQHCKSNIGYFCLRNLLRNPIKDVGELKKRLDFIEFAIIPSNQGFIEGLQNNIKKISNVNMILRKIYYRIANANDWERLYNIIFSILHVHELSLPYEQTSPLLSSLNAEITPKLYELQYFIYHALDFSQSNKENRPVIKFGLDDELDAKELKKQDIAKNATAAAQIAVNQLPDFLNECSVVYIPEMGHFVAVQKWEPNCDRNALGNHGFSFSFETNDCLHYKNSLCHELDKQLGNIYLDILAHQNRIIQRLSDLILKYSKDIEQPLKIIGMIDCFISISRVVKEKDYVRPELNENCIIEIVDGRHPLLELVNPNYVSNNFYSGDNHGRIQILTGPNDSGKSIFLKQTALIVYLAMVGCYVPAKKATIGIVHSIHTTTHCTESAAVNMSAFMIDLSKMSHSLLKAKPSSLVLIDEFGRGTSADDGISLLVSALKTFSSKEELCPHLLVSTHYQQISHFLPQSQLVSYKKMDHEIRDTGELIYLYKVVDGISNSYTFEVAIANGLDISIVNRAKEIYNMLTKNIPLTHPDNFNLSQTDLFDIKIPEPNN